MNREDQTCHFCGKLMPAGTVNTNYFRGKSEHSGNWYHEGCKQVAETRGMGTTPLCLDGATDRDQPTSGLAEAVSFGRAMANIIGPYVRGYTEQDISYMVRKELGLMKPKTINVVCNAETVFTMEVMHKSGENLAKILAMKDQDNLPFNVYVHGPAGTGKSHFIYEMIKSSKLDHEYMVFTPYTPEWKITGFVEATGKPVYSPFFRAFAERGCPFIIEEMDNMSQENQALMNLALSQGVFSFPWGTFKKKEGFRVIGLGNTTKGATSLHQGRRGFDDSFSSRFLFFEWKEDDKQEQKLAKQIAESKGTSWAIWIQKIRQYARKNFNDFSVTPRATYQGSCLLASGLHPYLVAKMTVFKGMLDLETEQDLLEKHPLPDFGEEVVVTRPGTE